MTINYNYSKIQMLLPCHNIDLHKIKWYFNTDYLTFSGVTYLEVRGTVNTRGALKVMPPIYSRGNVEIE